MTPPEQTPTTVYRHFDAEGTLLYVGISLNAVTRLAQHKDASGWFSSIAKVTMETFPTRDKAMAAEREAIRAEDPKYNLHRYTIKDLKRDKVQADVHALKSEAGLVQAMVAYRPVYTLPEVADVLCHSLNYVKMLIDDGHLPFIVLGERTVIHRITKVPALHRTLGVTGWALIDYIEKLEREAALIAAGKARRDVELATLKDQFEAKHQASKAQ